MNWMERMGLGAVVEIIGRAELDQLQAELASEVSATVGRGLSAAAQAILCRRELFRRIKRIDRVAVLIDQATVELDAADRVRLLSGLADGAQQESGEGALDPGTWRVVEALRSESPAQFCAVEDIVTIIDEQDAELAAHALAAKRPRAARLGAQDNG